MNSYLTITKNGTYKENIKKSEFICTIKRIQTEKEAKYIIDNVKKYNKKANHNCYAYVLGLNDEIQRQSDDGEPSGTAGIQILNTIKKNKLHNIIVIITRYFGGIKLGKGKLIRTYINITNNTILKLGITERIAMKPLIFIINYSEISRVKNYLKNNNIQIKRIKYYNNIIITVLIKNNSINTFKYNFREYMKKYIKIKTIEKKIYVDNIYNQINI